MFESIYKIQKTIVKSGDIKIKKKIFTSTKDYKKLDISQK